MLLLKTTFIKFALLFIFTGSLQAQKTEPVIIEGKVVTEANGQPVNNAHVFVLDGEEEALTNGKGEFKIKTWQRAPFKLTVEKHDGYRSTTITITDPKNKQVIRLKSK